MALLGIDLGTVRARAVVLPAKGEPSSSSVVEVPAMVAFGAKHVTAGEAVLMTAGALPDVVVAGIKRLVGRRADDPIVEAVCQRAALEALDHGEDLLLRAADATNGGPEMTLLAGTSELLRYLAESTFGQRARHEAVIAVPSWFDTAQRDVLAVAAKSADIEVKRFVRDTVATALWMSTAHGDQGKLGVVDVGAGGISVSLLSARADGIVLEASAGSDSIGADDIDAELGEPWLARASRQERELIRQTAQGMKRELLLSDQASRDVKSGGETKAMTVDRWQLDLLLARVAAEIAKLCDAALGEAGWRKGELDRVYASGGLTQFRPIAQQIANSLGGDVERPPEQENAVTLGAAAQAAIAHQTLAGPTLRDGEKPPRRDSLVAAANRATSKSNLLSSKVTTTRKQPERFRPAVTVRRKRKSQMPGRAASPAAQDDAIPKAPPTPNVPLPPAADDTPSPEPARVLTTPTPTAAETEPNEPRPPKRLSPVAAAAARLLTSPQRRNSAPKMPAVTEVDIKEKDAGGARLSISAMPAESEMPTSGELYKPESARDVLALALVRPLEAQDLEPIAMPVLLRRVLARKEVRGSVTIHGRSYDLAFDVADGNAELSRAEHSKLLRGFDLEEGQWELRQKPLMKPDREKHPLARIALEGVKRLLRALTAEQIDAAFGELLDSAPQIKPELDSLPKRLGLSGRELRFLETELDGRRSGRSAAESSALGPSTTLQLFALLELFEAILWSEVGQVGVPMDTQKRMTMKMKALGRRLPETGQQGGFRRRTTKGMFERVSSRPPRSSVTPSSAAPPSSLPPDSSSPASTAPSSAAPSSSTPPGSSKPPRR